MGEKYVQWRNDQPLCRVLYQFLAHTLLEFAGRVSGRCFSGNCLHIEKPLGTSDDCRWQRTRHESQYRSTTARPRLHSKRAPCQQSSPSRHLQSFPWPIYASVTPARWPKNLHMPSWLQSPLYHLPESSDSVWMQQLSGNTGIPFRKKKAKE